MKKSEMRKAYDNAIKKWVKTDSALQIYGSFINFQGFNEFEPKIGFVNEGCVCISYDGEEIDGEEAIRLMEQKGCITPDDF